MPKFHIESYGCQMNEHDAERMAGLLERDGYVPAAGAADADVIVVNTCSVRERAEEKLFTRLGEIKRDAEGRSPVVAVTGCVAQQEGSRLLTRAREVGVVLGTQAMHRLGALVTEALSSPGPARVDVNPYEDVSFPLGVVRRSDPVKAYVTIIEGCNDFCSFCVVPYTRGHERMRPSRDILSEVEQAARGGCREVQLLGQIVNHYQAPDDLACDFAQLLARVAEVPGIARVRFASPHPRHVTSALIGTIRDVDRVCKHLHLPVQSGSTSVLGRMHRRHTRGEYLDLVRAIRQAIPDIGLSTDIIVGFPGETDDDFQATLTLIEDVRFQSIFSFKYSPRPNTFASKRLADDVPEPVKSQRIVELQARQKAIQEAILGELVGREVEVLIDGPSRRRPHELTGRTSGNLIVNLPGGVDWIGRLATVHVERSGPNSVWGIPTDVEHHGSVDPRMFGDRLPAGASANHAD